MSRHAQKRDCMVDSFGKLTNQNSCEIYPYDKA